MEKQNPLFEYDSSEDIPFDMTLNDLAFPSHSAAITRTLNAVSKPARPAVNKQRRVSCKVCVAGTFAVMAVLALLVLAVGVVIIVVLERTGISTQNGAMQSDIDSQKQEIEILKQFVNNLTFQVEDLKKANGTQFENVTESIQQSLNSDFISRFENLTLQIDVLKRANVESDIEYLKAELSTTQSNFDNVTESIQQSLMELIKNGDFL